MSYRWNRNEHDACIRYRADKRAEKRAERIKPRLVSALTQLRLGLALLSALNHGRLSVIVDGEPLDAVVDSFGVDELGTATLHMIGGTGNA